MAKQAKEIVRAAFAYLSEVSPNHEKISEVRIEELEQDPESKVWKVVLSYDIIGDFPFDKERQYKEFLVSDDTGEVTSMKIKKI